MKVCDCECQCRYMMDGLVEIESTIEQLMYIHGIHEKKIQNLTDELNKIKDDHYGSEESEE